MVVGPKLEPELELEMAGRGLYSGAMVEAAFAGQSLVVPVECRAFVGPAAAAWDRA